MVAGAAGAVVVGAAVVGGGVVGGAVVVVARGAAGTEVVGSARKVTGTKMSWDRSVDLVWSLRVTTAHRTSRQSRPPPSVGVRDSSRLNVPAGP
jgi:hypothetical protein